jgi:hypothetical protein
MRKKRIKAMKRLKSKKSYGKSKLMDLVIGAILGNTLTKYVAKIPMVQNIPYSGVLIPAAVAYGTTMVKIPYGEGMAIGASVQAVNEGIKMFAPDIHAKFLAGRDEYVVSSASDPLAGAQFLLGESGQNSGMMNPLDRDEYVVSGASNDPLE